MKVYGILFRKEEADKWKGRKMSACLPWLNKSNRRSMKRRPTYYPDESSVSRHIKEDNSITTASVVENCETIDSAVLPETGTEGGLDRCHKEAEGINDVVVELRVAEQPKGDEIIPEQLSEQPKNKDEQRLPPQEVELVEKTSPPPPLKYTREGVRTDLIAVPVKMGNTPPNKLMLRSHFEAAKHEDDKVKEIPDFQHLQQPGDIRIDSVNHQAYGSPTMTASIRLLPSARRPPVPQQHMQPQHRMAMMMRPPLPSHNHIIVPSRHQMMMRMRMSPTPIPPFPPTNNNSVNQTNGIIPFVSEVLKKDFVFDRAIGIGSTSEVWRGFWRGTEVAIKILKASSDSLQNMDLENFRREMEVMLRIRHPNLVLFMGAATLTRPLCVVTEFCPGGNLFDLLHKRRDIVLMWHQRLALALDISKAMTFLHTHNPPIIHRDLKSLNILLTTKMRSPYDRPLAKITDFGLSVLKSSRSHMTGWAGTISWMAPEVVDGSAGYDEKVDVYSFGVCLYEISSRVTPYYEHEHMNPVQLGLMVSREGFRPNVAFLARDTPVGYIDLMKDCWRGNPQERPSFPKILDRLRAIGAQ